QATANNNTTARSGMNQLLVDTINHYQVGPAALIHGGHNWVMLVGYELDTAVAPPALKSVYVYNPKFPGGASAAPFTNYAQPSTQLPASTWDSSPFYWGDATDGASKKWGGLLVAVVDPSASNEPIASAPTITRADGSDLISAERAEDFARQIVEQ